MHLPQVPKNRVTSLTDGFEFLGVKLAETSKVKQVVCENPCFVLYLVKFCHFVLNNRQNNTYRRQVDTIVPTQKQ